MHSFRFGGIAAILICMTMSVAGQAKSRSLEIYAIDVEGGQATLIVTPDKQSLLIDTGWPGFEGRDADRIVAAAKLAGIPRINYVLITHYHSDHVGGIFQLADRIPIDTFVDHGPNLQDAAAPRKDYANYVKLAARGRHVVLKPSDTLPLQGITVVALTSAGEHITSSLPGGGKENQYCGSDAEPPVDLGENARSLGVLLSYGKFRFIDFGDLTRKKELEFFCPKNLVGSVDVFLVSHHGLSESNSKAMVWALHPRVAILDNGPKHGGHPVAWQIVHDSPGLPDIWQLHYSVAAEKDHNAPKAFIANPHESEDPGHYIKVTAQSNGTFTVLNSRNAYTKTYKK